MDSTDLAAVWLTLKLATVVTLLLLVVGTPIAWWLARTRSAFKGMVGAIVALPLVLPPTVLGFYLLVTMGPNGPIGQLTQALGLGLHPARDSVVPQDGDGAAGLKRARRRHHAVLVPHQQRVVEDRPQSPQRRADGRL